MTVVYAREEHDQPGVAPVDVLRLLEESDLGFPEWEEDRFKLRKATMLRAYHVREFRELDRAFDAVWAVVEEVLLAKSKRRRKWPN